MKLVIFGLFVSIEILSACSGGAKNISLNDPKAMKAFAGLKGGTVGELRDFLRSDDSISIVAIKKMGLGWIPFKHRPVSTEPIEAELRQNDRPFFAYCLIKYNENYSFTNIDASFRKGEVSEIDNETLIDIRLGAGPRETIK